MHLHFLPLTVSIPSETRGQLQFAHHLEGVQFLLDLLGEHGRQPIARSNFAATVVLLARPGVVVHETGIESGVALHRSLRCARRALRVLAKPQGRDKVVLASNRHRPASFVAKDLIVRRAGCAGVGRVRHVSSAGHVKSVNLVVRRLGRWRRCPTTIFCVKRSAA